MRFKAFALLWMIGGLMAPAEASGFRKGPYLIVPDGEPGMTVLWQTDGPATATLEWGSDTTFAMGLVEVEPATGDHLFHHTIRGLTPSQRIVYRVRTTDGVASGWFRAAPPADDTDLTLLALGDTRSWFRTAEGLAAAMWRAIDADPALPTLALHTGDVVYNGDSEQFWDDTWFSRDLPVVRALQACLPFHAARGNHEKSGALFRKYYPYPTQTPFYYAMEYGPVLLVWVDQYQPHLPGSAQGRWLEATLAASQKAWKFIILHEPAWTTGPHPNNLKAQRYIHPLCRRYGVQMVLGGHSHLYARCEVETVTHLTTGGGGAPLYAADPTRPYLEVWASSHHFVKIVITGDTMEVIAYGLDGQILDAFTRTSAVRPLDSAAWTLY